MQPAALSLSPPFRHHYVSLSLSLSLGASPGPSVASVPTRPPGPVGRVSPTLALDRVRLAAPTAYASQPSTACGAAGVRPAVEWRVEGPAGWCVSVGTRVGPGSRLPSWTPLGKGAPSGNGPLASPPRPRLSPRVAKGKGPMGRRRPSLSLGGRLAGDPEARRLWSFSRLSHRSRDRVRPAVCLRGATSSAACRGTSRPPAAGLGASRPGRAERIRLHRGAFRTAREVPRPPNESLWEKPDSLADFRNPHRLPCGGGGAARPEVPRGTWYTAAAGERCAACPGPENRLR